jgi:hypothetical protein
LLEPGLLKLELLFQREKLELLFQRELKRVFDRAAVALLVSSKTTVSSIGGGGAR